jgi:hypothetical protein
MRRDLVYKFNAEVGMTGRATGITKIIIAAAAAAMLGGCFHVPLRARENGRELGYGAESRVIYGQHNAHAMRQINTMIQSSSRGWQYAPTPYSPFQQWDW